MNPNQIRREMDMLYEGRKLGRVHPREYEDRMAELNRQLRLIHPQQVGRACRAEQESNLPPWEQSWEQRQYFSAAMVAVPSPTSTLLLLKDF